MMIYLVNNNVFTFNNGPEFSQFERLKALNEAGVKTRLLLRNYSTTLINELKRHQINPNYVVNMYDFFQDRVGFPEKDVNIHSIPSVDLSYYHLENVDANHSLLKEAGNTKAIVNVAPGTVGLAGSVEAQDRFGHKLQKDVWDRRGFLSRIDYYHWDGSLGTSRFLRSDGSTALLVTRMNNNGQLQKTMWKLLNYQGHDYVFDSEEQLFVFFLNEMGKEEKSVFVSDRRNTDWPVLMVDTAKKKIAYLHSVPFSNSKAVSNSSLSADVQLAIDPEQKSTRHFDDIVVPTQEQASQMQKLFSNRKFMSVNDSFVTTNDLPSKQHQSEIKIVYRGMLSPEKNIHDILEAFRQIHDKVPNAVLEMQGYFISAEYRDSLTKFVEKLKIQQQVRFVAYSAENDLSIFDGAKVFLNATHQESFGMNMLEALSCAVPVVTYDVPYVANNLVKNKENGLLVRRQNSRGLSSAVLKIIQNSDLQRKLANGALQTAKPYSDSQLVKQWKQISE